MNKKQKIIIMVLVLVLIIVCSGLSYAYFSSMSNNESSSTIYAKGGSMTVTYDNGSGNITIQNVYPRADAWVTKTFTVTGDNTTDLKINYSISLVVDNNTFEDSYLSYTLTGTNTSNNGSLIPTITTNQELLKGTGTYELGVGTFNKGTKVVHTYNLKMFFLDNGKEQNVSQEAKFAGHLIINSVNPDGSIVYNGSGRNLALSENSSLATVNKNFVVTNSENQEQIYIAKLIIEENTYPTDELKYTLTGTNTGNNGTMISNASNIPIQKGTNQEITLGTGTTTNSSSTHSYQITVTNSSTLSSVNKTETKNNIKLLIDEPAKETTTTKKFKARIEIKNISNTLSNHILKQGVNDSPKTSIGTTSTIDEGLIKNTDDYGTTYYYRGAVENNYVTFANMCWRIVRITGDGSVKLTLQNNDSASCVNLTNNSAALKLSSDTSPKTYQNERVTVYDSYPAMMYGKSDSSLGDIAYNNSTRLLSSTNDPIFVARPEPSRTQYSELYKNTYKNTYVTTLEKWYLEKLTKYTSKLADVVWCNDKNYNTSNSKFAAYDRLTAKTPTFTCINDNLGGKLSKYTVSDTKVGNAAFTYPIGLLTADELMFAGLSTSTETNSTNYLLNKIKTFDTMTPYNSTSLYMIYSSYGLNRLVDNNNGAYLRPTIALKSDVTINSGDGTASNPFVVE